MKKLAVLFVLFALLAFVMPTEAKQTQPAFIAGNIVHRQLVEADDPVMLYNTTILDWDTIDFSQEASAPYPCVKFVGDKVYTTGTEPVLINIMGNAFVMADDGSTPLDYLELGFTLYNRFDNSPIETFYFFMDEDTDAIWVNSFSHSFYWENPSATYISMFVNTGADARIDRISFMFQKIY
jgi:hypothetical protein